MHWLLQVNALKPDRFEPKIIKQEPDYLYVEYKVSLPPCDSLRHSNGEEVCVCCPAVANFWFHRRR